MTTVAEMTTYTCAECEQTFEDDENGWPGPDDSIICEECYLDLTSECPICGDWYIDEDEIGDFFLMVKESDMFGEDEPLQPGIYQVLRRPYYTDRYFDAWFGYGAIQRVGDLPNWDIDLFGAHCSYVCPSCEAMISNAHELRQAYEMVMV